MDKEVKVSDYTVTGGYVLIALNKIAETTASGIIKSKSIIEEEKKKQKELFHIIVQVGPQCKVEGLVPGNKILFEGKAISLFFGEKEYAQINDYNILGYIK
jgi:co-chaperonin GroES (HSP10)